MRLGYYYLISLDSIPPRYYNLSCTNPRTTVHRQVPTRRFCEVTRPTTPSDEIKSNPDGGYIFRSSHDALVLKYYHEWPTEIQPIGFIRPLQPQGEFNYKGKPVELARNMFVSCELKRHRPVTITMKVGLKESSAPSKCERSCTS